MTVELKLTTEQLKALLEAADALEYHVPGLTSARAALASAQKSALPARNPVVGTRPLRYRAGVEAAL